MSWISDSTLSWTHSLVVKILRCGKIPEHVAFIMDGNRRFARKKNIEKVEGHIKGFDKLSETLQWCLDVGIKEVTVYAFSIENFKRSKDEVDDLMELSRAKFKRLLEERQKLMDHGIKIRFIGNLTLLPEDLVKLIAEAELITKDNNKALLNVAFSYTAQDEMTNAFNLILEGLKEGSLEDSDVNLPLFTNCLYTHDSPPPDLIIRTSGETRLSDFLLWQGSFSYLHFAEVLWPEMSPWDFFWAIFKYQRAAKILDGPQKSFSNLEQLTPKGIKFINLVNNNHINFLKGTLIS